MTVFGLPSLHEVPSGSAWYEQVPSLWQMGANWHEFGGAHVVAHACVVSVTVPLSDPV